MTKVTEFTDNDFGTNVRILEDKLGHSVRETPCGLMKCSQGTADPMIIAARDGKFVTCALMEYLSNGKNSFHIDGEDHQVLSEFFAPLWDKEGHPSIDFFRDPGVHVLVTYYKNGKYQDLINEAWERSDEKHAKANYFGAVADILELLNHGAVRPAEPNDDAEMGWQINEWVKKAILLYMRFQDARLMGGEQSDSGWFDKIPLRFEGWGTMNFRRAKTRAVPGSVARSGTYVGENVVLMPSFVNIGAWVGDGTMVDTWATVGSCAQIGKNVHLSGGVGIGGVLEPLQANPTIIEDGAFIGARSEVVEGVVIRERAVLSMGVFIGKNTPIVDRTDGNRILRGEIPRNAVVMMGVHPSNGLSCPQIVKYRDDKTDEATALNEILRS